MTADLARLAEHAGIEPQKLRQHLADAAQDLDDHGRAVLRAVTGIADASVNRSTDVPALAERLAVLAAAEGRRGRAAPAGAELDAGVRRVLSARTVHTLRELGLYEDANGVEPVWSHAGMLILNPMLGCSFGCAYCFRADEQRESVDWFLDGRPTQVIDEEEVVERLARHPLFVPGRTQLGLHTATTEPFLPQVRRSTFRLLELLEERGWGNDVMIITKHFIRDRDVEALAAFESFRILLFLTYNAAPREMETMGASPGFRARRIRTAELLRDHPRLSAAHYYRPIVPGWNDSDEQIADALAFGERLGTTVIGGLKEVPNLADISARRGLRLPVVESGGEEKHFPPELVERILGLHRDMGLTSTVVGDQSCGLTVMLSRRAARAVPNVEAVRMYDAASARRAKCLGRCSVEQLAACGVPPRPTAAEVRGSLERFGVRADVRVEDDGVYLRSAEPPQRNSIESLAALLRFAVFWEPSQGARNPSGRGSAVSHEEGIQGG